LSSNGSDSGAGAGRNLSPERDVVLVAANSSFALTNYRLNLLKALQDAGYRVVAAVPQYEGASKLVDEGIEVRFVPVAPHGTSVARELLLLRGYYRLLRELRPRAFLGFTIKPNIYGALAARAVRVPVINNVTGLGLVFTKGGLLRRIVGALYRVAFRRAYRVFFQNRESRDLFLSLGFVREDQAFLLPGSGIDLHRFAPGRARKPAEEPPFTFLLPSRLMREKGVAEYCEAAGWFRAHRPGVRFQLLGAVEPSWNKAGIPREQIARWEREGVEYLGSTDDVRPFFAAADCIVLPSYYPEGVPRALIEAAAMGKPVITTDTPGCRDVVDDTKTGFLCAPRSAEDLVRAMVRLMGLDPGERAAMGERARDKAERQFDEKLVIDAYLSALKSLAP
jgi:glycosyltransferase involved in cell wall biosynthesis